MDGGSIKFDIWKTSILHVKCSIYGPFYLAHWPLFNNFIVAELCWAELMCSDSGTWNFWRRSMSKCHEETLSRGHLHLIIFQPKKNKWNKGSRLIFIRYPIQDFCVKLVCTNRTPQALIWLLPRWSCRTQHTMCLKASRDCWDNCGCVYILVCSACYTKVKEGEELLWMHIETT